MTMPTPVRQVATASLIAPTFIALMLSLGAPPATAQNYPSKPVRVIVPLSAGSAGDAVARILNNPLAKTLGQPLVIDNLPGAGGVPGTLQLTRAAKDGHTIGVVSSNHVINPSIYKSVPFDSIKDITPITVIASSPVVLVVHPSVAATDTRGLLALAKAKPGTLHYGSSGNGSLLHLAGVLFATEAGVDVKHVPYKGTGPLVTDLVGGHIEMGFLPVSAAAGHVKSGKLRAIGVSTPTRAPTMPEVPTLAESGLPKYSLDGWLALIGPAGLPPAIVDRLYSETKAALSLKEVQDAFAAQGFSIIASPPESTAKFFQAQLERYTRLVKQAGVTPE
jgi:tripartite-type tricarboxylate transporter receptor subunit TctC